MILPALLLSDPKSYIIVDSGWPTIDGVPIKHEELVSWTEEQWDAHYRASREKTIDILNRQLAESEALIKQIKRSLQTLGYSSECSEQTQMV